MGKHYFPGSFREREQQTYLFELIMVGKKSSVKICSLEQLVLTKENEHSEVRICSHPV